MEKELKAKLEYAILSALRWRGKTDKRLERRAEDELQGPNVAVLTAKTVQASTKSVQASTKTVQASTNLEERGIPQMLAYVHEASCPKSFTFRW